MILQKDKVDSHELEFLERNPLIKKIKFLYAGRSHTPTMRVHLQSGAVSDMELVVGDSSIYDYYENFLKEYTEDMEHYFYYDNLGQLLEDKNVSEPIGLKTLYPKLYDALDRIGILDGKMKSDSFVVLELSGMRYIVLTETEYENGNLF